MQLITNNNRQKQDQILNIKKILDSLSQEFETDFKFIDINSLVDNQSKESAKYLLMSLINVINFLKESNNKNNLKAIKKEISNNDNNQDNLKIIKKETSNGDNIIINITERNITNNEKYQNSLQGRFNKYIDTVAESVGNNIKKISENFSMDKIKRNPNDNKKNNLKLHPFYLTSYQINKKTHSKQQNKLLNKKNYFNEKNNYHLYMPIENLIDEILKIIQKILSFEEFYNFLCDRFFVSKMYKILQEIKFIHLIKHRTLCVSKHFINDHLMEIKFIINKIIKNEKKKTITINKTNLSKLFNYIGHLKKLHNLNSILIGHEVKEKLMYHDYLKLKEKKKFNNINKNYGKLLEMNNNLFKEEKELNDLMYNMNIYQKMDKSTDIINYLKLRNKELIAFYGNFNK